MNYNYTQSLYGGKEATKIGQRMVLLMGSAQAGNALSAVGSQKRGCPGERSWLGRTWEGAFAVLLVSCFSIWLLLMSVPIR